MGIKKTLSIVFVLIVLCSCKFQKTNSAYDSYLGDETLAFYLTFNGDNYNKSTSSFKNNKGTTMFAKDRFGNENSSASFKDKNYLSYGDILDSIFSGEKKRFTFSFWINPLKNNKQAFIISKNADSNCEENERQFSIKLSKGNKISFLWLYNNSQFNGWRMFETEEIISIGKWQNVIISYDGQAKGGDGAKRVNLYLNGKKQSLSIKSKRGRLGFISDKKAHFAIGNMVNSLGDICTNSFFQGYLDDVMIFKRILTQNEIEHIGSLKK